MKRAIIAGGSLGGLMTAVLLRRDGWSVDIFEKVGDDLADRGGGITTDDLTWSLLDHAGIEVRSCHGVHLAKRVVFAPDGTVMAERDVDQVVTSWDALYRLLRAKIPDDRYHRGCAVSDVRDAGDAVLVSFEDGEERSGDLLIAADGAGSTVRGKLLPDSKPIYANYVAWRGLAVEKDLDPLALAALAGSFSFCAPPGEQMLSYTILGPNGEDTEGERRHNFVWYRPAEPGEALPDLLTDDEGHVHDGRIPPPKIRSAVIEALRADAERILSPAYAALIRSTEHPFLQPVYDHVAQRLAFGRTVLIGDAAAQARPHVGTGTTKAFQDATALADALRAEPDVPKALEAFEAARLPASRDMVEHGRWLGRYLDPLHRRGDEGQTPEEMLGDVANSGTP